MHINKHEATVEIDGKEYKASFDDEETARLWIAFKKKVSNEMKAFSFQLDKNMTLKEAIEIKLKDLEKIKSDSRAIGDVKICLHYFKDWLDLPINQITSEMVKNRCTEMLMEKAYSLTQESRYGRKNPGDKLTSPRTVRRKIGAFSSVFGHLIKQGADLINPTISAMALLRDLEKK